MPVLSRRLGRTPRRARHRGSIRAAGLVALALAGSLVATATPTAAAEPDAPAAVVGGGQLASPGIVYDTTAGVAAPPPVVAGGWVVADLDTGEVLGASNPHGKFGPASTLKILTALVMLPLIPPTQQIVATSEAVNVDGSKVGVVPTHTYTADMLFTAMLSVSGNDATRVLTSALGGDDAVLASMNAKTAQLQADDTVAKTVTGLDGPGQSTSAYDLALIARAALDLPAFRKYIAVPTAQFAGVDVPGFQITNHNLLLGHYPGTFGVKNGYTDASRATYVGAATQNGHSLMVSIVRTDPNYRNAAESLLNWGFAADGKVAPVGKLVGPKVQTQPPAPVAAPQAATALAATSAPRATTTLSGLEYGAIGAGAALIVLFFARRRQIKRRKLYRKQSRLRLPSL